MTSNLYSGLLEINKKYETTTFIDIDIIELFNLKSHTKKTITTKYYNLALKYHPDKYNNNNNEQLIQINKTIINSEEIKTGLFLSFITDIYKLLIDNIDDLFQLIDGNFNSINNNGDHSKLKQSSKKNIEIHNEKNEFKNEKISEIKLNNGEIENLINNEKEKRHKLKIEKIFSDTEEKCDGFKNIFNDKFISLTPDTETTNEIIAYNELNTNNKLISTRLTTSISDINEAFQPIKINRKQIREKITYEEIINKRDIEAKNFKN
jgi:hypothetical protein